MELYFAGNGFPQSCAFIYSEGYSRLFSFPNLKPRIEKYIFNKSGIVL